MAGIIRLKRNFATGNVPSTLDPGEVAVNVADKRLWVGDSGNTPIEFPFSGGGGGTGGAGLSVISFGATGALSASLAITGQTAITGSSVVIVQLAAVATADHSVDEHMLEDMAVLAGSVAVGVGFTIYARPRDGKKRYGNYTVSWIWR